MSSCLYICRSQLIVTSLRLNQSINRYFIFSRVRVNVALLLPQIPLPPLINLRRHGPCLPSFRCRLGGGWPYLHCRCTLSAKAINLSKWTIRFRKLDTPVFPKTLNCGPARSSSNSASEPRRGSLVTLSKVLLCLGFDRKVRQHILATPLRNRSSPAMAHYRMEIYNGTTIMPSIYANPEVRYANYLPTPQVYNTNLIDR
jgi:hypothetical protein